MAKNPVLECVSKFVLCQPAIKRKEAVVFLCILFLLQLYARVIPIFHHTFIDKICKSIRLNYCYITNVKIINNSPTLIFLATRHSNFFVEYIFSIFICFLFQKSIVKPRPCHNFFWKIFFQKRHMITTEEFLFISWRVP